ncbi:MAG: ribonuclease P protein component [Tissierellia bacterium]|nr:ribonuclease P protein component [Tissierellia bacterium]
MEKSLRLRKNSDYQQVFKKGRSHWNKHFTIVMRKNEETGPRIGFTITKKYGNAVQRNRKRRQLKEIVRNNQQALISGYDLVIIPKKNTLTMNYHELEDSLTQLFAFISKKTPRPKGKRQRK